MRPNPTTRNKRDLLHVTFKQCCFSPSASTSNGLNSPPGSFVGIFLLYLFLDTFLHFGVPLEALILFSFFPSPYEPVLQMSPPCSSLTNSAPLSHLKYLAL